MISQNNLTGARKVAVWEQILLHRYEDLTSGPWAHVKLDVVACIAAAQQPENA